MSHTQLLYHIVICPRHRSGAIPPDHERELYTYIWGYIKNKRGILHRMGGMPDHIHMLVQLPPDISIADFVRDMKVAAGRYMRQHADLFPDFSAWGEGYCAMTRSYREKNLIIDYIAHQKEHHQHTTFRDELIKFLEDEGLQVDERYLPGW